MSKIARFAAETKPRSAASRHIFAPAPSFWGLLPTRLSSLPATVRAQLGPALDRGAIRFVRDGVTGDALVTRAAR